MEQQANESEAKDSYKVITFSGETLPANYGPLVFSRFLRGLRYGNDYFRLIDGDTYFKIYHLVLETILARPTTKVNFAVLSDDKDVVLGFSIVEPGVLHFVHVQSDYRNAGIGTSLVPGPVDTITHLTKNGIALWNTKLPKAKFNPWR